MIPWQAFTAATGGWVLTGTCVTFIFTGWLVTRREHRATLKRAETAEAERAALIKQNAELMEMVRLAKHSFKSLNEAADR